MGGVSVRRGWRARIEKGAPHDALSHVLHGRHGDCVRSAGRETKDEDDRGQRGDEAAAEGGATARHWRVDGLVWSAVSLSWSGCRALCCEGSRERGGAEVTQSHEDEDGERANESSTVRVVQLSTVYRTLHSLA